MDALELVRLRQMMAEIAPDFTDGSSATEIRLRAEVGDPEHGIEACAIEVAVAEDWLTVSTHVMGTGLDEAWMVVLTNTVNAESRCAMAVWEQARARTRVSVSLPFRLVHEAQDLEDLIDEVAFIASEAAQMQVELQEDDLADGAA